ncbi:MAG: HEAT repeat domain-containing protein, partial [Planctomycetota bacterium]
MKRLTWLLLLLPLIAMAQEEAPPEDPVGEAKKLKDEAREFFNTAGNTDLSFKERKAARKEAYVRLKKAMALLDGYLEDHPDEAESLEDLYSEIAMMLYWIRKEAGVGELEGPAKPAPKKEPEPEPTPVPTEPEPPKGPTAEEALSEIEQYEKRFPGDVPGLHERYKDFLSEFPDTSTPEYAKAVERLEKLDQRLKDVYRLVRDDDPDSLEAVDDAKVLKLIKQLTLDLQKGSPPVRERAARFLGALGSGEAAPPLIDVLKKEERGDPVFEAAAESLAKIGGRRVCAKLLRVKPGSALGPTVVDILCMTVERGGVNARLAGEALADYAVDFDPGV